MISPNLSESAKKFLISQSFVMHFHHGIPVVTVESVNEGLQLGKDLLYQVVDKKTALFLSGGRTPKDLYTTLAKEEKLHVGAVGMIDERFGKKWHEQSNETMMRDAGLLRYLQHRDIPFYPILQNDELRREETADLYDQKVREIFATFHKNIGILGIGLDGHTAGIAGNRQDFTNPLFEATRKTLMVSEFDDPLGMFKQRVTMTFLALSMLDFMLVLVFGDDKKQALQDLFVDGPEEEIPARFFKRPDIAPKTLFITDQKV